MENKNKTLTIDVRPKTDIYTICKNLTYNIKSAISELIDNSIASFRANIDLLETREILICFNNNAKSIIVVDTAAGISTENIPRSLILKERPKNRKGLNEFGMGLKASAFWFGEELNIKTLSIEGNRNEYGMDLKSLELGNHEIKAIHYDKPLPIFRNSQHGTFIQINKIIRNITFKSIESLVPELASKYRRDIKRNKINIKILLKEKAGNKWVDVIKSYSSNEKVKQELKNLSSFQALFYKGPEYYEENNKIWIDDINGSFTYWSNKEKINKIINYTGKIYIKKKFDRNNYIGFDLIRRNIVILPNYCEKNLTGSTESVKFARLSGYIELDGLEVNQQKDNFQWDDYIKDEFNKSIKNNIIYKEYAKKADSIRVRSNIDPQKWNSQKKAKSNHNINMLTKQCHISKDIINIKDESWNGKPVDVARLIKIGELEWRIYIVWKENAKNIIEIEKDEKERILYAKMDLNLKLFNPMNSNSAFIEFITLFFIAYLKSYIECNEYGRSVDEFHESFIGSLKELNEK